MAQKPTKKQLAFFKRHHIQVDRDMTRYQACLKIDEFIAEHPEINPPATEKQIEFMKRFHMYIKEDLDVVEAWDLIAVKIAQLNADGNNYNIEDLEE